jgi:hypothetical protein
MLAPTAAAAARTSGLRPRWDPCGAGAPRAARPAASCERWSLEASLLEDAAPELHCAIREHRELLARNRRSVRAALSEIDRPGEILIRRARHQDRHRATTPVPAARSVAPA